MSIYLKHRLTVALLFQLAIVVLIIGCSSNNSDPQSVNSSDVLRIASTTSMRDSGLMEILLPDFEQRENCRVELIAVGSGAAIKLGEAGDVDALICHAPNAEDQFMAAGHGVRDEVIMHNYFLIVGPADDPAGIGKNSVIEAYQRLASSNAKFVSRGDDSGTHKKEKSIARKADVQANWENYVETGQGQGQTLTVADQMNAYTLTDLGTWLNQKNHLRLVVIIDQNEQLINPYSVLLTNPDKHDAINHTLAEAFADYLLSEQTQQKIDAYRVEGQRLFIPARLKVKADQ
jgi:tungstate transport system substrate-binding protein